jgi:hypothetical protein
VDPGESVVSLPRPLTLAIVAASLASLALSVVMFAGADFASAELLIFAPALVAFVVVGGFVLIRQPTNVVGMLMLAFGAGGSVIYPLAAVAAAPTGTPGAPLAGLVVQALDPITYLIISLLLLVFPDGRLPSPRWRPIVPIAMAGFALSVIGNLFTAGDLLVFPQHVNPLGLDAFMLTFAGGIGYLLSAVVMLAAAASLVVRWRRSERLVRTQLKWIAFSGTLLGVTTALYVLSFFAWRVGLPLLPLIGTAVSFSLLPVTIAIAVLRYRLYEIDRFISRTIGWALVTGILVAVFALLVVGLQAVLAPFTTGDTLAVAVSTLVAFALFQPLRQRVQRTVDRRFNRARVDAQRAIDAFGAQLRDDVDLTAVRGRLVVAASTAVQPDSASVWIRGRAR